MVDWAIEKGLKIKGHVLCWHVTTPGFVERMSGDQIREELKRHIFTTMGMFDAVVSFDRILQKSEFSNLNYLTFNEFCFV